MMRGDYKPGFDHKDIGGWLKNLLNQYDSNLPKIFFNHDLLTNGEHFSFKINNNESISLNDYNLKAWLYGHWHLNMVKSHGTSGITSYGTSTPVMGGIDHSPSGFRIVEVDQDGNTLSNFRWTYLTNKIEIVAPMDKKAFFNPEGNVDILVNAYHSGAVIDSVKYGIWGDEGFNWDSSLESWRWKKMNQSSDWSWSASIFAEKESHIELVVDAYLHNGDVMHAKKKFEVIDAVGSDIINANWTNLGGDQGHNAIANEHHNMPYELIWHANVGSNIYMSSPVIYQNYVITASFDDGDAERCKIVCFEASSGAKQWEIKA